MINEHLLREVEIPNFMDQIVLSRKRRKQFYSLETNIPKKYQSSSYCFNAKGVLIDIETREPILKNPRTAGTERIKKISGQEMWSGMHCHLRSKIAKSLKIHFYHYIKDLEPLAADDYPIGISLDVYDIMAGNADIDNLTSIYRKTLHDTLSGNVEFIKSDDGKFYPDRETYHQTIEDDDLNHVQYISSRFYPVDTTDERKLVIKIFKL